MTVHKLFRLLGVRITYSSIKDKLLQHPKYPSLFSLTSTLGNLGLENKAVRIKKEQLGQLETPFLAISTLTDDVIVKAVHDGTIEYSTPKKGMVSSSIADFEKMWDGLVILVDTSAKLEEKGYTKKRNLERLRYLKFPLAVSVGIVVLTSIFTGLGSILLKLMFLSNLIGLSLAVLLVAKVINKDIKYPFCKIGNKMDCDSVLNSKAAKIYGWVSLTDLGLLFFSSTTLALAMSAFAPPIVDDGLFALVALLGFLVLPFTVYSIFYQGFVIKKWCVLCLGIVAILWTNGTLGYLYISETGFDSHFPGKSLFLLLLCIAGLVAIWTFLKDILIKSLNHETLHYSNLRVLNNSKVFQLLLENQKSVPMDFQEMEIVLGSSDSQNTLTVAMNPFCPACQQEFNYLTELLENHPSFANVIIRFTGSVNSLDKSILYMSKLLADIYLTNRDVFTEALKDWFENRDVKTIMGKYPHKTQQESKTIVEHSFIWSEKVNIRSTPTIFINDREFPMNYRISNLLQILYYEPYT